MPSKLTVYIDDSIRQLLKESAGTESQSKLVNDALESYMSASLVKDLSPQSKSKVSAFPSLSEVVKRRPRVRGSSAVIISSQRRKRDASLS